MQGGVRFILQLCASLLRAHCPDETDLAFTAFASIPARSRRYSCQFTEDQVEAIPLPQIADRAEELRKELLRIYQQLGVTQEALPSEDALQSRDEEIRERAASVADLIAGVPTSLELRDEDHYWSSLSREFTSQRTLLTSQATTLENQIEFLQSQLLIWQTTWDQIHLTPGIRTVIDHVQQELENINNTRLQVQHQLNRVLTLQNQISQEERKIMEVLTKVAHARAQLNGHLFERDGHPLWNSSEGREPSRPMIFSIQRAMRRQLRFSF